MRKAMATGLLLASVTVAAGPGTGDRYYGQLAPLYLEAARASTRGDHAAAAAAFSRALQLAPDDTITLWEAAGASARSGDRPRALELLERLAAQKPGWVPGAAFASLRGDPRFERVARTLAEQNPRAHAAAVAFTISEKDVIPEGVAYDPASRTLFLGSIHQRKVIAVAPDGTHRDLTRPGQDGLRSALGMKVDGGRLWVASGAESGEGAGGAALHAFDVGTGRTVERYELAAEAGSGGKHLFNDLVVVRGDVYVTDSEAGSVYRLDRTRKELRELVPAGTFVYPNGIAADPEGTRLFVASWGPGVSVVDLATRGVTQLGYAEGAAPAGIDGLSFVAGTLVGVQNEIEPARVTRFVLDAARTTVVRAEVLEAAHPAFDIPTTGVVVGHDLLLLANSQLDRERQGVIVRPTDPVRVLRLPLPRPSGEPR